VFAAYALQPHGRVTRKRTLAFVAFVVADVAIFAAGVAYATATRALSYHEQALGSPWEQLPLRVQELYLIMLKVVAAPTLLVAVALLLLLLIPWRRGERWALVAVPAIALGYALPMLAITLHVRATTGAETPALALAIGSAVVLAAAVLSTETPARRSARANPPAPFTPQSSNGESR
jgi:hypothetical protein